VAALRRENVTPHMARNEQRPGGSAIDERAVVVWGRMDC
jgi:hypothetical protein